MSQTSSDTAFRSKRAPAKDLSTPQLRALRKELLLMRADVERMELAQSTTELRQAIMHFNWLRFLVPGFGGLRRGASKGGDAGVAALLKSYPLISSIASILLAKPIRARLIAGAKPVLKWGSLGIAAWEAYRIWQQVKRERNENPKESAGSAS
jgi:hypothetical protein